MGILLLAAIPLAMIAAPAEGPTWESPVHADVGIPVDWKGNTLFLYGDSFADDGRFVNSSVLLPDGEVLWQPLPAGPNGRWFWIEDAVQTDDGLLVVAGEVERTGPGIWGFRGVDTDAFLVRDPLELMSWRFAEHIDAGWWDGHNVQFIDDTLAVVRRWDHPETWLYDIDAATARPLFVGESHGIFAPVRHDGYWWGVSYDVWSGEAVLWRNLALTTEWESVAEWNHGPTVTYLHGVAVIDDELIRYWSTLNGRVTYEVVTSGTPT